MKAITTVYNNYKFRSRLEARWAIFLDLLGIRYEYEKEGFELCTSEGDTVRYLPDFWLPDLKCWMEVKGELKDFEEREESDFWKPHLLSEQQEYPVIFVAGPIGMTKLEGDYWPPDYSPNYLGVVFTNGYMSSDCVWTECFHCKKYGMSPFYRFFKLGYLERLFCDCYKYHIDKPLWDEPEEPYGGNYFDLSLSSYIKYFLMSSNPEFLAAYAIARQARFEYGESVAKYGPEHIKEYRDKMDMW